MTETDKKGKYLPKEEGALEIELTDGQKIKVYPGTFLHRLLQERAKQPKQGGER